MKSKEKRLIYILIIGFAISSLNMDIIDFQNQMLGYDKNTEETSLFNLKSSGYWVLIDTTIFIDDTAPYWSNSINWITAATQDWCSGTGTVIDPYVIENLTMIGYDYQACIWIIDSNVHFIIRNCTFINAGQGLHIMGSVDGKLVNNTFTNNRGGTHFTGCQDFTISENKFNENRNGLLVSQGDNYNISKNSFNGNYIGLEIVNDVMNSLINANTIEDSQSGIYFSSMDGENNIFSSNIMNGCGFDYGDEVWDPPVWIKKTNTIETSNLVNGKTVYFYHNELNLRSDNFTNAGQVLLIECNNSQVSDLNISNCSIGISMNLCKNNTLIDSNFSNSSIALRKCNNITLNNNIVSDFESPGISLYYGKGYNLTNNQMFDCGFWIRGDIKDMYLYNIDTSNKVNGKPLYYFINKTGLNSSTFQDAGQLILIECEESSIMDFNFSNCYIGILGYNCNNNTFSNITSRDNFIGITLDNCSNNRILNCNIRDCSAIGLGAHLGKFNTIKGCTISNSEYSGITLTGDENIVKENTLVANLQYGINVHGDHNNITNNEIFNNKMSGIHLENNYNLVVGNNITHNQEHGIDVSFYYHWITQNNISNNKYNGIFLNDAHNITILENDIIKNNRSGIFMYRWCDNNDVKGNDIKFNDEFGIFLHDDTNFNTIFNNNFTGNLVNAEDNGTINTWDNGITGNYWDDYTGVDANDDGIGDVAYDVLPVGGSMDNYPIWDDGDDDAPPVIVIISPVSNQVFGTNAPNFQIDIKTLYTNSTWYTIDEGISNHSCGLTGQIDQTLWDLLPGGTYTLRFYANDTSGNIGYSQVIIIKTAIKTTESVIPGFDSLIVFFTILITLISITQQMRKKRKLIV